MKENKTNRKWFYTIQEILKENKIEHTDNLIYQILQISNNFENYTQLVLNFDKKHAKPRYLLKILRKIIKGLPLQYVIGYACFLDSKIFVNKSTLIPREETAELVLKIEKIYEENTTAPSKILDCCAGSGCIGISLKKKYKDAELTFIEKYRRTFSVLKKNIRENKIECNCIKGDCFKILKKPNNKYDLFVSNPPYVDTKENIDKLVIKNEPINAIYVEKGTKFYELFFKHSSLFLQDKYLMAFEIDECLKKELEELINKYFRKDDVQYLFKKDLYNKIRFLFISNYLILK